MARQKPDPLRSWKSGATRRAIVEFVERVTRPASPSYVAPEDRVAVFDDDGTLWCEKPTSAEHQFIGGQRNGHVARDGYAHGHVSARADGHAHGEIDGHFGGHFARHFAGDGALARSPLAALAIVSAERYQSAALDFLRQARHPSLGRRLRDCAYLPMLELLRYLEQHDFVSYVASAGDCEFVRVVSDGIYGIPADRVIGSSRAIRFAESDAGGTIEIVAPLGADDDGTARPLRIWQRLGRRPILVVGNADGDIPMLRFAGGPGKPALRLLVQHDDQTREFAYADGAEHALALAHAHHWPVVSIAHDWKTVFAGAPARRTARRHAAGHATDQVTASGRAPGAGEIRA